MRVRKIQLTNFRCFASLEVELDSRLTVFVGQNAAGKSALVEAINIGLGPIMERLRRLYASRLEEHDLRRDPNGVPSPIAEIAVECANPELKWGLQKLRDKSPSTFGEIHQLRPSLGRNRQGLNSFLDDLLDRHRRGQPFDLPIFAFYEADRAAKDAAGPKPGQDPYYERFGAYVKAHRAGISFTEAVAWFGRTQHESLANPGSGAARALDVVKTAVSRLLPGVETIEFQPVSDRLGARFRSPTGAMVELPVSRLSHGYQGMLALVMDFARRLATANPQNSSPLASEAICLIDEVDLHLHPEWQQHVVQNLLEVFSNTQFILTTHSPQVLTTIAPCHIRRIDYEKESQRHILREPTSSLGAESWRLMHDIMRVDPRPQQDTGSLFTSGQEPVATLLQRYLEMVRHGQGRNSEALALRARLDHLTNREEPELERADAEMRRQELFGK